jgi:nucleotide-binding universal stress UspA family protein
MYKHILTPLDGSPFAESVLPYVVDLARKPGARVTLLMVVTQAPFVYAAENLAMLDELRELDAQAARRYLDGVVQRLAAQGLSAVDTRIDHGRPADCICATADGLGTLPGSASRISAARAAGRAPSWDRAGGWS